MVLHVRDIVLILHILLGIIWFGGILFVGWGVYPAVKKLAIWEQRHCLIALMRHCHKLFSLAGLGVIVTGVILGTMLAPINDWQDLSASSYGQLFTAAFLTAVTSLVWGMLVSYQYTMHMLLHDQIWTYAEKGGIEPLQQAMRRTTIVSSVEVLGLIVVVVIMVLL